MDADLYPARISLLWPDGVPSPSSGGLTGETIRDLDLNALGAYLCPQEHHREVVCGILFQLCQEPEVIRYRQQVLNDLVSFPGIADAFRALLPMLEELGYFSPANFEEETSLQKVIQRAGELQLLVDCVEKLRQEFQAVDGKVRSPGLLSLKNYIESLGTSSEFQGLIEELPEILRSLRSCRSITIGVNLDHHLQPEEAVLLSANEDRFTESGMLSRLLGEDRIGRKGLAPLHKLPLINQGTRMITGGLPLTGRLQRARPAMVPLFRDLSEVLEKTTRPIARQLKRFVNLNSQILIDLYPEMIFFVSALDLAQKMEGAGLPVCLPEIASPDVRSCEISNSYNIQLALQYWVQHPDQSLAEKIVTNEVSLGPQGRIAILTGPNQGGKTTYLQGIGQAFVMAQAGMFVPGSQAIISPADGIFTHYPTEEKLERGTGRFGDEAGRRRKIFESSTRLSLVLLNESLSSTNLSESLYLAQDIVRVLRKLGLRAVYTTHLHELAFSTDDLNQKTVGDSEIISLVASSEWAVSEGADGAVDNGDYSYRVVKSPPLGRSYADRIAVQHGISLEQLLRLLEERQILDD